MTQFEIPLSNIPQKFAITLAGVDYNMIVKWNDQEDAGWVLDIFDTDDNPIAVNIPLVTGINLLEGLEYLGINGILFVNSDGDTFAIPTLDNLGTDSHLYFLTDVNNNG